MGATFESYDDWCAYLDANQERHTKRWSFEQALSALCADDFWLGYCDLCKKCVRFQLPRTVLERKRSLREEVVCDCCRMNTRVRAGFHLAEEVIKASDARIYITEQASHNFVWLQRRHPKAIGSEYAMDATVKAKLKQYLHDLGGTGDIRFEDVTRLSFLDGELDAVLSFDVLEHVPDYQAALGEFARVLRKGGVLVLTAPFISQHESTTVRARLDSKGEIDHLLPAEYHGDPLENGGILCFYHFGWDLVDHARQAGFSKACMALPWSPGMGLVGNLWTLVAYK